MKFGIKGVIVPNDDKWMYDWLDMDATSPRDIHKAIEQANGEQLDIDINSGGGDIAAGSEIYAALQTYPGEVRLHIVGQACSAASVIACAGYCDMTPTALLMIHNVSMETRGDHRDMAHATDVLQTANRSIAAAYRAKTGKSEEELLAYMDAETWMTAEDAVAAGFVDAIAQPAAGMRMVAATGGLLSDETIGRLRARRMSAQLELLKLQNKMEVCKL